MIFIFRFVLTKTYFNMKKITLSLFLLGSLLANAQTITQSTSLTVEPENSIACSQQGFATADNSYFRFFKLADDHNITQAYTVTSVNFGVETLLTAAAGSHPIKVSLYATTAAFPAGFATLTGYTLVTEQSFNVPDQEAVSTFTANITGTIPAGSNLVVELSYLGDTTGNTILFIGSNDDGETGPTYIKSTGCGIEAPTLVSGVAPPGSVMNLVMSVVGTTGTAGIENNVLNSVALYPNPTNGLVTIQVPNGLLVNSATLTDVTGKVMNVNVNANTVNIANYASGVYFLNLTTDQGNVTRKIVKE